ncbi:type II toxin-antitoxin system PemK/MazF family toxin [Mangrovibrevibacter kandeliae]|uniref:type II toxin-antitoxin system PemK/MazF family toxin n=1 Tax=Mangrovibrevibacter kandeliae TaxID=2968473 RepID=UPI002118D70D|nr:type II toxin-antitoxin system PemK/MazF family toxin [Aurantimonas sp. CSK15Z-1]MCQ8780892.1 type II toxin-antitoxin system PemK/MazF family toxin [Aurantimonas sp. CSK15Z-1]
MKRGDVYTISTRGDVAKPRPAVVLKADEFIRSDLPIIVCPLTSDLRDAALLRVRIEPTTENGLRAVSEAMLERLGAALPKEIGTHIGRLDRSDRDRVEVGIINILGLTQAAAILSAIGNLR